MQKAYPNQQTSNRYFPIETYSSLSQFVKQIDHKQNELHVFSTSQVANQVKRKTNFYTTSIRDIHTNLFVPFRTAKFDIYLQSLCRQRIIASNYNHKDYLLNRLSEIIESFYVFVELGLNDLQYSFHHSKKDEVFDIINYLLKDPVTETYFAKKAAYDKKEISFKISEHTETNTIIFYEVDYMNFGRMSFIHWLQAKGFNVEFRVPYQSTFPAIYKFWNTVYSVVTNTFLSDVVKEAELTKAGNRFGYFHENKQLSTKDRENITIMEFETPHDFSIYAKKHPDNLLAVDPTELSTIIENRKSPIYENGLDKFIYNIQFCRVKEGNLYLTFDTLVELITSDCIRTKSNKGSHALALLMDIEEYLSGTETLEDVKDRLQQLAELDYLSKTFDRENAEDAGRNRLKRYMLNPFRTFSFLNQDRYQITINQLIELVKRTEKICKTLIPEENSTINVNAYFNSWRNFLHEEIEDSDHKVFWNIIFSEEYPADWDFSIHELLQLIYLEASSKVKEQKVIKSIASIQEEIMESDNQMMHITNLTQMNFPITPESVLSVFFSYSDIKKCIQSHSINKSRLLHSLLTDYTVTQSFENLAIYQLYQLLADFKGPITFSWIKNLRKNDFRNIYLDILADLYTDGEIKIYQPSTTEWNVEPTPAEYPIQAEVENLKGKIPGLYWLDHDFCSKKFFLTTFIDQQPIYESDFHHQFLFSKIGKFFSYSGNAREEFRSLIYPLFPHWTFTKKENLIDMEYKTEFRKYKSFENISYPKEMKNLHLLRSVYRENRRTKARNQYKKEKQFNDKELIKQFSENINTFHVKAEPGNHCKMCPHLNSCTEGMYAIDNLSQ